MFCFYYCISFANENDKQDIIGTVLCNGDLVCIHEQCLQQVLRYGSSGFESTKHTFHVLKTVRTD